MAALPTCSRYQPSQALSEPAPTRSSELETRCSRGDPAITFWTTRFQIAPTTIIAPSNPAEKNVMLVAVEKCRGRGLRAQPQAQCGEEDGNDMHDRFGKV
jgi:hypothetical protein